MPPLPHANDTNGVSLKNCQLFASACTNRYPNTPITNEIISAGLISTTTRSSIDVIFARST